MVGWGGYFGKEGENVEFHITKPAAILASESARE
jgi:hypothetical protein